MDYKSSKYLIYYCFSSQILNGSEIKGSLLLDAANTEDEAKEKIIMYKERNGDLNNSSRYYKYISNSPEWW
jgi:hypothetical protein